MKTSNRFNAITLNMTHCRGVMERNSRGGFALLTVLFVLLSLLVLSAPFLLTARNVSKSSHRLSDRAQVRIALDSASRHARGALSQSHASRDATPFYDSSNELSASPQYQTEFLNSNDPNGVMWDAEAEDLAGRIDLNSANPYIIGNLLRWVARTSKPVEGSAKKFEISSASGLPLAGTLWISGEYIRYNRLEGNEVGDCVRGLGANPDDPCGPRMPRGHDPGTPIMDQRSMAPMVWRLSGAQGWRTFEAIEQVAGVSDYCLTGGYSAEELAIFARFCTTWGGVRGERTWQRPVRVTNSLTGGASCAIQVDQGRWFNPGCTVQITNGIVTETAWVQRVNGNRIVLEQPLINDYLPYEAELRVLIRQPVNINSAPPEVLEALFANLKMVGTNSRITGGEARKLAQLVVDSRPLQSHEDFLRRVVLPAAGIEDLPDGAPKPEVFKEGIGGVIGAYDALALYRNGLNANDSALEVSTMPYSFTSRDLYDLKLRASVNAKSGVERTSAERQEVRSVLPQDELLHLWSRQEDFDSAQRLDREAPYWGTGPRAVARFDRGSTPPSRLWAHMGVLEGNVYLPGVSDIPEDADPENPPIPQRVFADREDPDLGYAQPLAHRIQDPPNSYTRHFDHETRDPEGRFLPDQTVALDAQTDATWVDSDGLFRNLHGSFWFRPEDQTDGVLLDAGSSNLENDRVTVDMQGGELVLTVRDAIGDHPDTVFEERAEVRLELASEAGPGLSDSTWSHVSFDVNGTRPDQMNMLVDGQRYGVNTPGLTRLAAPLGFSDGLVSIEDDEGFPDTGVVIIGQELIEYRKSGPNALEAFRIEAGPEGARGGRLAREVFSTAQGGNQEPGLNGAIGKLTSHPAGTPVRLYGYSIPLRSNVQPTNATLQEELGGFAVAKVSGIQDGQTNQGDPITVTLNGPFGPQVFTIGTGLAVPENSSATGVELLPADDGMDPAEVQKAFHQGGGYAVLMQGAIGTFTGANNTQDVSNLRIGGIEVIRYSGFDGNVLQISERGILSAEASQNPDFNGGGAPGRAFVLNWQALIIENGEVYNPEVPPNQLRWEIFVVPISVPARGGDFDDPLAVNFSDVVQLTRLDNAEMTEWVRYDEVLGSLGGPQLVRNSDRALIDLYRAMIDPGVINPDGNGQPDGGPGSGGGPTDSGIVGPDQLAFGGFRLPSVGLTLSTGVELPPGAAGPNSSNSTSEPIAANSLVGPTIEPLLKASNLASAAPAQGTQSGGGSQWSPTHGMPEDSEFPITRAAREAFQFRGVMGTYPHTHPAGTLMLPVARVRYSRGNVAAGRPGRRDAAFLVDATPQLLDDRAWPVRVHRAYIPLDHIFTPWDFQEPPSSLGSVSRTESRVDNFAIYVGFEQPVVVPIAGSEADPNAAVNTVQNPLQLDMREVPRLVMFPSGELPRLGQLVTMGSNILGNDIPNATIDELELRSTDFERGPQNVLLQPLAPGDQNISFVPDVNRTAFGDFGVTGASTGRFAQDAGLLMIGEEILCYESFDSGGNILIAPGGRGLLGTSEANHQPGEAIQYLGAYEVSLLVGGVSADDGVLPLESSDGFPTEGTARLRDELIHYTRTGGNTLEMPRKSTVPGENDQRAAGFFRGRFGTQPTGHAPGTPVIAHPFRYWDRGAEDADGPELSYMSFALPQMGAFWRSVFWEEQSPASGGSYYEVLQRSDPSAPWDTEPSGQGPLQLLRKGFVEGNPNPINLQSDLLEWRVFLRFNPSAYDPFQGASHGWKEVPRLKFFGTEYIAPSMVLRSVDQ